MLYMNTVKEYMCIKNHGEAIHLCLKALKMLMRNSGQRHAVSCGVILKTLHHNLKEEEKTLKQSRNLVSELKKMGRGSWLISFFKVLAAHIQLDYGRYNEAVDTLTSAISHAGEDDNQRALAMGLMGKALWKLKKVAESKKCLEISLNFFDNEETYYPMGVVEMSLTETSEVYEEMKETETSILILKRLLERLENSQEQYLAGPVVGTLGKLLLYNGNTAEALPYLESAVDQVKGYDDDELQSKACYYNDLGHAYLTLNRPKSAAEAFENAKDIMDVVNGPNHTESLGVCVNLCKAYAAIGRNDEAMKLLKRVIEDLKENGADAEDHLDDATKLLDQLFKEKRRK